MAAATAPPWLPVAPQIIILRFEFINRQVAWQIVVINAAFVYRHLRPKVHFTEMEGEAHAERVE
jgi:hypothetical protein